MFNTKLLRKIKAFHKTFEEKSKDSFCDVFSLFQLNNRKAIIINELRQANIQILYVDNIESAVSIRGKIFPFTLSRNNHYYFITYKKDNFLNNMLTDFYYKSKETEGFAFSYGMSIDTNKNEVKIYNQYTLNIFAKYFRDNESYIKINTL